MTDINKLRELAARAACERWITDQKLCQGSDISLFRLERNGELVSLHALLCEAYQAGQFCAAASPKTILALLDEIDQIKAENETLREALFQISSASCSDARSVVIARTALTKGATQ